MSGLTICEYYNNGHCLKYDEDCFNQCVQKQVSEDAISRATVLEIYSDLYWMDERLLNFKDELDKVYEKLRNAPSVMPKPKEGECPYFIDGVWCNLVGKKMKGADE